MAVAPSTDDRGIHYIAVYKTVKAVAQVLLAIALLVVAGEKTLDHVHAFLVTLQQHVTAAWSQHLVTLVTKTLTPGHVHLAAAICFVDGIFTSIEGYALHTRKVWGEWLVVVATGGLVPIEAYELFAKTSIVRIVLLVVNIGVVWYLARRQLRRHAAKKTHVAVATTQPTMSPKMPSAAAPTSHPL